jgi:lysophospholipase L1-like esterase
LQFAPSRASVDGEAFRHNLERIAELAEEAGARVLFVDYPLRPLALGEHPHFENIYRGAGETSYAGFHQTHERYQRIVAGVAEARHLPFVDTRARMVSAAQQAYSGADFVHPNDVGAEIIASEVLDAFLELEWLSDPGEQ